MPTFQLSNIFCVIIIYDDTIQFTANVHLRSLDQVAPRGDGLTTRKNAGAVNRYAKNPLGRVQGKFE